VKQWFARRTDGTFRLYQISAKTEEAAVRAFAKVVEDKDCSDPDELGIEVFEVKSLRPGDVLSLDGS
jgi:hypothetical protein